MTCCQLQQSLPFTHRFSTPSGKEWNCKFSSWRTHGHALHQGKWVGRHSSAEVPPPPLPTPIGNRGNAAQQCLWLISWYWGQILDKIQTKVLRVFLLAIHSHLYSFALRFLFLKLTQPLTVSTVHLLYTTLPRRKEKNLIENNAHFLWFKKFIRKPQVWELLRLCPVTSTKLYVHEFGFRPHIC